jgi:hypothetical protein
MEHAGGRAGKFQGRKKRALLRRTHQGSPSGTRELRFARIRTASYAAMSRPICTESLVPSEIVFWLLDSPVAPVFPSRPARQ